MGSHELLCPAPYLGVWFIPQRQFCLPKMAHLELVYSIVELQNIEKERLLTHLKFENRLRSISSPSPLIIRFTG